MSICPVCGCAVGDTTLHDRWHAIDDAGPDLAALLIDWLDELDPDHVQRLALEGAGMNVNATTATIDALKTLARQAGP